MDKMKAYAELAADLDRYRRLPYDELVKRIGGPSIQRIVNCLQGPISIEICFQWTSANESAVRISATAYGPGSWRLERIEEAVNVISPPL